MGDWFPPLGLQTTLIMKLLNQISLFASCLLLCACVDTPEQPKQNGDNPDLSNTRTVAKMPRSTKRGVSFSITSLQDAVLLSESSCWYYNWGNNAPGSADVQSFLEDNDIDFCPMCWSGNYNADRIRNYVNAHPNVKYLLGFNEPNLTDQANMTPAQAAEKWPEVVALAKELNLKLGAPAMNYGTLTGYSDPCKWLDEFFRQPGCSIDDIDFIPIHCYMTSCAAVKGYVEKFYKYNKPIWMTEFCAWEISGVDVQKSYMSDVLNYFEATPQVERYAWFMPRTNKQLNEKPYNQLLTKVNPIEWTPLGEIFNGMSSQDKSVCLDASYRIPATQYCTYSDNFYPAVTNSTDEGMKLMVFNFNKDHWIQYQLDAASAFSSLDIRYASSIDSQLLIYVDGEMLSDIFTLPKTGSMSTWETITLPNVELQGKHTLRLHILQGTINFSWFKLQQ